MVSPGALRALSELQSGDNDAFEPSIGETGVVTYPAVERHLEGRDGTALEFLETMVDRGVLSSEFRHKVYVCPTCSAEGMQYATGCSNCGSIHATQEPTLVHPVCGGALGADRIDDPAEPENATNEPDPDRSTPQDTVYCSDCDEEVTLDDLERDRRYRCHDCDSWVDVPTHRLWCRDCSDTSPPEDAHEQPLYRYSLTSFGDRWITEQLDGRRSLAVTLEERGYDTTVDTTVPVADDELSVHVYADDALFDDRIVADVHGSPTQDDVRRLAEAAHATGARPIVLLTDGSVDERVAGLVDERDVTVVSAADGELTREYGVNERSGDERRLIDRLGSFLPSSTPNR